MAVTTMVTSTLMGSAPLPRLSDVSHPRGASMSVLRAVAIFGFAVLPSGCASYSETAKSSEDPLWGGRVAASQKPPSVRKTRSPVRTAAPSVRSTVDRANDLKPFTPEWYAVENEYDRKLAQKLTVCRGCGVRVFSEPQPSTIRPSDAMRMRDRLLRPFAHLP